jgi:flagellar protein FlgJ
MDNAAAAKTLSGFAYSDVNRLSQIKTQGQAGIRAAAQQFESLFIDMVMTSMRQAGSAFADGDYTSSDATKMQQEMLDHQWAVHISENGGVGLADVIVKQLSGTLGARHAPSQLTMPKTAGVAPLEAVNPAAAPAAPEPAPGIDPVAPEWTLGSLLATGGAPNAPAPVDAAAAEPATPPDETAGAQDDSNEADDDPALTVTTMGSKDSAFDTPNDFVAKVLPVLKNALAGSGLNPLMVLAQGALETGWGAHVIHDANGDSSHNLFNIKASGDWDGPAVEVSTVEFRGGQPVLQRDRFRAYDSVESAVRDYLSVLKGDQRYQRALDSAQDPSRFADELQKAGYATDPHYAAKIVRVLTGGALRAALSSLGR